MDSTNNQTAAQAAGAPQPDAPAPEQPTKSATETKLEGQLAAAKTKGEGYKKERDAATKERDELRLENGQLKADNERLTQEVADAKAPVTTAPAEAAATVAAEEPSQEAYIKELLQRNGLKTAWLLADGSPCFSEAHARHMSGADFDSLTVITAE